MKQNRFILASAVFVSVTIGSVSLPPKPRSLVANNAGTKPPSNLRQEQAEAISLGDVCFDEHTLNYNDYVVEKLRRRVKDDFGAETQSGPLLIDVAYAVLKHNGRVIATFDDNIYFGMGNSVCFGLFTFLKGPTKQPAVSQDRFRGGKQWIVSLSPRPRIIFDGPNWAVGREGDDMEIVDLDHDGAYEIVAPITDFYDFQDKLPISQIPLPEIVFKYDGRTKKYVPANPVFPGYALRNLEDRKIEKLTDEFDQRATFLRNLLAFIYVGKESRAWDLYNRSYSLSDKEELRRRVKAILIRQPVYKFIYNPRSSH